MATWVPCGEEFVTGDVIRWVEPVWKPKEKQTDRGEKIGYRLVTAQVMRSDSEWVSLEVMSCKHHLQDGWSVATLEGHIRRRRGPIGQGGAQRALVGDHEARAITASRYLNEPDGPTPQVPKAAAPHPGNGRRPCRAAAAERTRRIRASGEAERAPRQGMSPKAGDSAGSRALRASAL